MAAITIILGDGEPTVRAWRVAHFAEFAQLVLTAVGAPAGRAPIVARWPQFERQDNSGGPS